MSSRAEHAPESLEYDDASVEPPPDGGYGWVVVGACFTLNCFTWGVTAVSAAHVCLFLSQLV